MLLSMRYFFAILAILGLLMTPVAASAGAVACLHHGGEAGGMAAEAAQAPHTAHAADHSCCDENGAPAKHDSQSCAKACAAMCVASVALTNEGLQTQPPEGRLDVEALPPKAFHASAPPSLKRPPRTVA